MLGRIGQDGGRGGGEMCGGIDQGVGGGGKEMA